MSELVLPHLLPGKLVRGVFVARPNRFLGRVSLADGRTVEAHIGDRGRLEQILAPGVEVHLVAAPEGAARRTAYSLLLVRTPALGTADRSVLVMITPGQSSRLVEALIAAGKLRGVPRRAIVRREVRALDSRFDLEATPPEDARILIEVKTAGAAAGRAALFPDAPSERARRHAHTLAKLARQGERAMIVFVTSRHDAAEIRPHPVDPEFASALARAREAGVELRGAAFRAEIDGLHYDGPRPVRL
jgi:sugar fermentation stimulation protein A